MIKNEIETVCILGLGSIGRRHARILNSLNKNIKLYTYRTKKGTLKDTPEYIADIDEKEYKSKFFDLIIVSNPSSLHLRTIKEIIKNDNVSKIFVEKPFCLSSEINQCKKLVSKTKNILFYPGSCVRFHSGVNLIRELVKTRELGKPLECMAHFGSYMPNWHPYEDYRNSYASRKNLGGGVLHTSIHEIDLVCHLFGKPKLVGNYINNISLKKIDVEDIAHMLLTTEKCKVVNVSLNFFQKPLCRYLEICFENGTVTWNFMNPFVSIKKDEKEQRKKIDSRIDSMYENMWKSLLKNNREYFEMDSVYNSLNIIKQILK
jgi:predicted dehydrogenase